MTTSSGNPLSERQTRPVPAPDELLLDEPFEERDLAALRRTVAAHADRAGLTRRRGADLVLVACELASNAVRHGGGHGRLRLWIADDMVYCQVSDSGPGIPRTHRLPTERPDPSALGGRGLWLVLHFCDNLRLDNGTDGGAVITAALPMTAPSPPE